MELFVYSSFCFMFIFVHHTVDGGDFLNQPSPAYVHENIDDVYTVWTVDAECEVTYYCSELRCDEYLYMGSWFNWYYTCRYYYATAVCSTTVKCDTCWTNSAMFTGSGKTIRKEACSSGGCGPTCSSTNCLNDNEVYSVYVECKASGYITEGNIATTLEIRTTANSAPSISLRYGSSVSVSKSNTRNHAVNIIDANNPDSGTGYDYIIYSVADTSKFIAYDQETTRTDELFYLDGNVLRVNKDLSTEYSYTYSGIQLCIRDRRSSTICTDLTITLYGCFQIPSCYDQGPQTFSDQHGIGSTLFTMTYPNPSGHFTSFSSTWQGLQWTLVGSDLNVASVDYSGGILKTSGNITVWPYYPSRSYYADIRVGNSDSCGRTRTCRMTFTVTFTNWPIRFESLPNSMTQHENYDDVFLVHQIVTFDYNDPDQDNVTCEMSFTPYESNLLELRHDGGYSSNSWSIYRLACQVPKCEFDCPLNKGCFNHDIYSQYVISVTCRDFYGSDVSSTFTLNIEDNTPPALTATNEAIVYINKDTHGQDDPVTRVWATNTDYHYDDDYIRYWVVDDSKFIAWDYPNVTRTDRLFYLDTATGYIYVAADLSMEYSYTFSGIELCIRDRRDTDICRSLTIKLTACYEIPTCYDQEYLDFWDTHAVGDTLFEMKYPDPTYQFPGEFRSNWLDLHWTIVDTDLDVAEMVQVEPNDGIFRPSANITVWPSWPYRDYFATIRVSNTESCGRTTTCVLTFRIWFKNWPISFISLPNQMNVHENVDEEFLVHQVITYDYNNPAHDNVTCQMSFTPYEDNFFELRHDGGHRHDSWSIWRFACQYPKCEYNCPLNAGCFTYDTTADHKFVFTIRCDDAYDSDITDIFTLYLDDNSPPYLTAANVPTVYISKETHTKDSFVTRIFAEDDDLDVDDDYIRWNITDDTKLIPWDYPNVTRTDRLFYIDGLTGDIYVAADLSMEYSYVFRGIEVCVADRRDAWICRDLTIWMTACYEIPTCYDQEYLDFWDTHAVGDTLFDMKYPSPTYHFPEDFRSDWLDLTWSQDYSELDVSEVVQNEDNGINEGLMKTFANITVWPSWRYRDYLAIIRVKNDESCGRETTCRMTFRIWFKNWPIRFISLPDQMTVNEDFNDYFLVHQIITYDYNYHLHDNATCEMSFIPHEDNLFELRHDGNYDYNSWSIHRLPCQEPTCGFHCDTGIGCFTYNTTLNQRFVFTVHCWDAYDSDVTDYFTLYLDYNRAPTFTNLPNTITLNSDTVSDKDILYSIMYSDNENEDFHYNYTFSPNNGIWNDKLIFECDQFGNYYNDRANITSTTYYHEMPASTYYIYICGTERRNMICETLTVNIQDHCPSNPTCTRDSDTRSDTTPVGTLLFQINAQQDPSSGGTLTYAFTSPTPAYFHVDQASGEITLAKDLVAMYPSKTYQLTAYVYDSEACNYGSCQFTVTATFTNYPIIIVNLPYTYEDLPEDTETNEALIAIETTDENTDDSVTCSRIEITSADTTDPIDQDLFRVVQTFSGSNVWYIENRELPEFTAAILEYVIDIECHDKYDSTAEATLTVTIKANETPTFTNLGANTTITVDPSVDGKNSIIYSVSTNDFENDPLVFTSEVDSSYNPLALTDAGVVYLRRDVSIINEDGLSYDMKICINDTQHNLQPEVCGVLTVTFISSQKYPVISNLPDSVAFPENTAGGTVIFNVDVEDENFDSVHTFSMTVDPPETASMFSLHAPTGVLTLQPAAEFDYETLDTYTFTFAVKDQYLVGLEKKKLILNITNVNEMPSINIEEDIISFDEDAVPGKVLAKAVASCNDLDLSDTHTFTLAPSLHSTYFSMNETTSELSLAMEWDLESSLPTSTSLTIVCTDPGNLSSNDSISVSISPINEFDPVIVPTTMSVTINSETTVVDTLGEITNVTDEDCGGDCSFYYDIIGVGHGKQYFTMTQAGQLRLKNEMSSKNDRYFKFTISVSDTDATPRPRTAYCSVTANYTAPAEEVPEEPTYCTTCTTEGKIVVAAFAVEGCVLIAFLVHIIHHCYSVSSSGLNSAPVNTFTNVAGPQSITNSGTQPAQNTNSTNQPQNRPQNNQQNDQRNNNDNDNVSDEESISDDSDIDERLRSPDQLFPRNQPFPAAIDAAHLVAPPPAFGAWNYA